MGATPPTGTRCPAAIARRGLRVRVRTSDARRSRSCRARRRRARAWRPRRWSSRTRSDRCANGRASSHRVRSRSRAYNRAVRERGSLDELLAAVCATPHDDAPRQVYADALIEAGDPLGESGSRSSFAKARGALDVAGEARHGEHRPRARHRGGGSHRRHARRLRHVCPRLSAGAACLGQRHVGRGHAWVRDARADRCARRGRRRHRARGARSSERRQPSRDLVAEVLARRARVRRTTRMDDAHDPRRCTTIALPSPATYAEAADARVAPAWLSRGLRG